MNHARPAPVLRRIVLLVALVGAVVVGLLAMHTLSEHPTGAVSAPMVTSEHHHAGSTVSSHAHEGVAPCNDDGCGGGSLHTMAAIGCVLALLILLVIVAPRTAPRGGADPREQSGPLPRAELPARSHPPDLAVLCISRT